MEVIIIPIIDLILYAIGYGIFFWILKKIVRPVNPSY
jgi:nitrogen fixation-related uncharacterized protein